MTDNHEDSPRHEAPLIPLTMCLIRLPLRNGSTDAAELEKRLAPHLGCQGYKYSRTHRTPSPSTPLRRFCNKWGYEIEMFSLIMIGAPLGYSILIPFAFIHQHKWLETLIAVVGVFMLALAFFLTEDRCSRHHRRVRVAARAISGTLIFLASLVAISRIEV